MNLSFEQFCELAQTYTVIPVYDTLSADLDTPVSAFLKIREGENDFLFESVVGGETWGRYSFLGTRPRKIFRLLNGVFQVEEADGKIEAINCEGSPLNVLRDEFESFNAYTDGVLPRFFGGIVGYFSYDMVKYFDNILLSNPRDSRIPDLCFLLTDTVVVFDNLKQTMTVVHTAILSPADQKDPERLKVLYDEALDKVQRTQDNLRKPLKVSEASTLAGGLDFKVSLTKQSYCDMVNHAKEYIAAGDIFQVVLSMRYEMERNGIDAFQVYRELRRINPSPYLYFLQLGDLNIVGASPEVLVRVEDNKVAVRPIAGTRKRGGDPEEDKTLESDLKADPKELAEHIMLVDLGRNDVGRASKIGSVHVDEFEVVERYSHVMHLVSHVSGVLDTDKDVFDVIAATFPAGTLSGAPKIRAMEIIEELEPVARGVYGGAIGYVSFTRNTDLAIAIRTAVFLEDEIIVQAGAGIVYHSVPEKEFEECENKAKAMMTAIKSS